MSALCPSCGQPNDAGADFCPSCGEYMRWEETGVQPSVEAPPGPPAAPGPPPPAPPAGGAAAPARAGGAPAPPAAARQPPAAQPAAPEAVLIAVRRPEDEGYAAEGVGVAVEPGGQTALRVLVRNQSGIVDNYDLGVEGIPEGWWTIAPATVYLVPFGAPGGSYEQEVEVLLHPPRDPEAEAREWEIAIVARSRTHDVTASSPTGTLEIAPYSELETAIAPERRSGRLQAGFTVSVANKANAPVDVTFSGVDPDEELGFTFRETGRPGGGRRIDLGQLADRGVQRAAGLGVGRGGVADIGKRAMGRATAGSEGRLVRLLRRRKRLPPVIEALRLAPGENAEAALTVVPPKQIWIGRSALRPFQVTAQPVGAEVPAPPVAATFRQRQWLPWWLLIAIPLLVLLIIWLLSMRTAEVTVPDLSSAPDVFGAEAQLKEAGLVMGEKFEEQDLEATAGAIVEQTPAAGESVAKGSVVSIKVAVGDGKLEVPDVTGSTGGEAAAALKAAGLQLGRSLTEAQDPAAAVIKEQIPVAGTREAEGAAVDVVFEEAAAPGGEPTAPGGGAAPPGAGGAPGVLPVPDPPPAAGTPPPPGSGAPSPGQTTPGTPGAPPAAGGFPEPAPPSPGSGIEVPVVTGQPQSRAAELVSQAGLVPATVSVLSETVPAGQVAGQEPAPGTEVAAQGTVVMQVSLGFPSLLFDSDGDLVRAAATGPEPVLATPDVEEQPSTSRATRLVVLRRGAEGSIRGVAPSAQIWAIDPADPRSARPLTTPGFNDRRPALSPDGRVVAFASNRGGRPEDFDLCFADVERAGAEPRCVVDRDVNVSRPAWSPDGRSILVTASDGPQTELLLYTSIVPSSGNPADWTAQGLVTDDMHGDRRRDQVLSSAFSPDGTRLAFTANWRDGAFKLFLVPVENGVIGAEAEPQTLIAGCEIAWRPDGAELAVAQRDSACDEKGRIVRVAPDRPTEQIVLTEVGKDSGNPVWALP